MSPGLENSCMLTPAGAAHCWGYNDLGQLGDASMVARSMPVPVAGGLTFAMINVGAFHTCGVTTNAVAFCWGNNSNGQLGAATAQTCVRGAATVPCTTSPVRVTGTIQVAASVARAGALEARPQAAHPSTLLRMLEPAWGIRGVEPRAPPRRQ